MILRTSVLFAILSCCTYSQTEGTFYRDFPLLYNLQNYDECIFQQHPSKYCLLISQIEPDQNSTLWRNIENISRDSYTRFRHDILFFGVCVDQCKDKERGFKDYFKETSLENEVVEHYKRIYVGTEDDRLIYHSYLEKCVNADFYQIYNLTLKTFIEYCDNERVYTDHDYPKNVFYVTMILFIALNLVSTAYDYYLKTKHIQVERCFNFYAIELQNSGQAILTSFSLNRNYERLTKPCQTVYDHDLQFTYGFRVFTMFIVILGHVLMTITTIPLKNTDFIENHFNQANSIIFQNGSALIQIFFVLTGFLFKCNFDKKQLITPDSAKANVIVVYLLYFLDRYLRFFPPLALLIFLNSSYLMQLGSGPLWKHISEPEHVTCSKFWWKNVLMINNFMMEDSCAHHTWYLAADMQLYELYLIVAIATAMKPRSKKCIYALLGILAFVTPGFITFFYKLEAFPYLKPESYRYFYFKDVDTFYKTYPQFYCNLGGHLVGFICADIYLKYIQRDRSFSADNLRNNVKLQILFLVLILTFGFGLLFSGLLVMHGSGDNKPSSEVIALYASCYRNLWAILGGIILIGMLFKFGWIAYEICCLPLFRVLGRITFQMYIWHTTILRILFGCYREPILINNLYVVCQIVLAFILTVLLAFFVALLVDFPMSNLVNVLLKHLTNKLQNTMDRSRQVNINL